MKIILSRIKDAAALSDYYLRNADRFTPWHPLVNVDHHSVEAWKRRLQERERDFNEGRAAHFIALVAERVVATCSLSNIVYHPACFCHLGYSVDREHEGTGCMTELVRYVIDYGFDKLRLNRISANYMPVNTRSARLLEKLGFEKEGFARRYLCINGKWEDHVLTSLINPQVKDQNVDPEDLQDTRPP
jgi:ribosomal-protein-alanine N-acetyltransferase